MQRTPVKPQRQATQNTGLGHPQANQEVSDHQQQNIMPNTQEPPLHNFAQRNLFSPLAQEVGLGGPFEDENLNQNPGEEFQRDNQVLSPTPTDQTLEEITQRLSRMEESRTQRAGAQEPPPTDQLGDNGNAAHQNKEEDACSNRLHEFQQRTIKHLSAPSRKFYEAVRALHFQLDNPNFTDDVSKQYGDGLLRDVEENYKIVEEAREYCLEVLELEERMQNHRAEYLDHKFEEVLLCRRIHSKYFEHQEEKKRQEQQYQEQQSQKQLRQKLQFQGQMPPPTPGFAPNTSIRMSTPFPQHSKQSFRPPFDDLGQQGTQQGQSRPRSQPGFNDFGQQGAHYGQSQQRQQQGFDDLGQEGAHYGQSQQRQQQGFDDLGQQGAQYGQSQQRQQQRCDDLGQQGPQYDQSQQRPPLFNIYEDHGQRSRKATSTAPMFENHYRPRFKLIEELALVEKWDGSQPGTYMIFRHQWKNFYDKMMKEERTGMDMYQALLKVLGGAAKAMAQTKYPTDESYAHAISKLDKHFYNPTIFLRDMVRNLTKTQKMNDSYGSLFDGLNKLYDAWNDLEQADLSIEQLKGLFFITATEKNLSEESWKYWLEFQNDPQHAYNPMAAYSTPAYLGAIQKAMNNAQKRINVLGPRENNPRTQAKPGKKQSTLFGAYSNAVQSKPQSQSNPPSNAQTPKQARGPNGTCVICGQTPHKYQLNCFKLRKMSVDEIYKVMTNYGINCQMCLELGHRTKDCPAFKKGILTTCRAKENGQECKKNHCRFLHRTKKTTEEKNETPQPKQE